MSAPPPDGYGQWVGTPNVAPSETPLCPDCGNNRGGWAAYNHCPVCAYRRSRAPEPAPAPDLLAQCPKARMALARARVLLCGWEETGNGYIALPAAARDLREAIDYFRPSDPEGAPSVRQGAPSLGGILAGRCRRCDHFDAHVDGCRHECCTCGTRSPEAADVDRADLAVVTRALIQTRLDLVDTNNTLARVRALVADGGINGWLQVETVRRAVDGQAT